MQGSQERTEALSYYSFPPSAPPKKLSLALPPPSRKPGNAQPPSPRASLVKSLSPQKSFVQVPRNEQLLRVGVRSQRSPSPLASPRLEGSPSFRIARVLDLDSKSKGGARVQRGASLAAPADRPFQAVFKELRIKSEQFEALSNRDDALVTLGQVLGREKAELASRIGALDRRLAAERQDSKVNEHRLRMEVLSLSHYVSALKSENKALMEKATEDEDEEARVKEEAKEELMQLVESLRGQIADLEMEKVALASIIGNQEAKYGEKLQALVAQMAALQLRSKPSAATAEKQMATVTSELASLRTRLNESERSLDKVTNGHTLDAKTGSKESVEEGDNGSNLKAELTAAQENARVILLEALRSRRYSFRKSKVRNDSPCELVRSKSLWRELDDNQKEISQLRAERDFLATKIQSMQAGDEDTKRTWLQILFPFWECRSYSC